MKMEEHPKREKLERFLRNELIADEAAEILLHLDQCEICRKLAANEDPKKIKQVIEELFAEETGL